jgi:hypothetical protein
VGLGVEIRRTSMAFDRGCVVLGMMSKKFSRPPEQRQAVSPTAVALERGMALNRRRCVIGGS